MMHSPFRSLRAVDIDSGSPCTRAAREELAAVSGDTTMETIR